MLVVLVVSASSSLPYNPRPRKIIKSLSKKYRLLVLEWDRTKKFEPIEIVNEHVTVKRFRVKAPFGRPHLVLLWPVFWLWVIMNIIIVKPRLVYSCNLDTLIPAQISSFLLFKKVKIVFDSFDKFSLAFVPLRHKILFRVTDFIENLLAYSSDAFITVSKDRLATYGKYMSRHVVIIPNCPEQMLTTIPDRKVKIRKNSEFVLVYAGAINSGLILLKKAITNMDGIKLYLAGYGGDYILKQLISDSKIQYLGLLPYEKALLLQAQADVVPVLYDPSIPINRVANPNKLFEAMMLGVPVITNVCKDIVSETKCGIVVNYDSNEVRNALLLLISNPQLRTRLGMNGRRAFLNKYNWSIMEMKLLRLCERLLSREH